MNTYRYKSSLGRDASQGMLLGVCSGLAKHWQRPNWMIRTAAIAGILLAPAFTIFAYVVAGLVLDSK